MWYKVRTGQDADGAYTEYLIEDDGNTGGLDWHGYLDIDGLFRVVRERDHLDPRHAAGHADFTGASPREVSSAATANFIYLEDRPAFPPDGRINTTAASGSGSTDGGRTNYGINAAVCSNPGPDTSS